MYSFVTPHIQRLLHPRFVWSINSSKRTIYLTFDDGPDEEATQFTLDQLEKYQAKATFFLIGQEVEKFPEITMEIHRLGHRIGNHTQTHPSGWRMRGNDYLEEIKQCDQTLLSLGIETNLFRPPYGKPNYLVVNNILTAHELVMWSHLSGDFDANLNVNKSESSLKKATSGSILLFHTMPRAFTHLKRLLPVTLQYFCDQGFTFSAIP